MKLKKCTCPLCHKNYVSNTAIYDHMLREHQDEIPKDMEVDQYFYDLTHNGHRNKCVVCHRETEWNPRTHKYHRICGSDSCKNKIREEFKKRMLMKYDTYNLAKDPEHQRKMLAGRSISDIYHWKDGGETSYTGTYEKDFLVLCEDILNLQSSDILAPSPHTYIYKYNGEKHFYIPDFYFPELNIEIEIKDGGDNPNMHHKIQEVDKVKEREKDKVMETQHSVHYIKIPNKNYSRFLKEFTRIRSGSISDSEEKEKIVITG